MKELCDTHVEIFNIDIYINFRISNYYVLYILSRMRLIIHFLSSPSYSIVNESNNRLNNKKFKAYRTIYGILHWLVWLLVTVSIVYSRRGVTVLINNIYIYIYNSIYNNVNSTFYMWNLPRQRWAMCANCFSMGYICRNLNEKR